MNFTEAKTKNILSLFILFIFAGLVAYIKTKFFISETNGDMPEYLLAARFFSGEEGVELFPQRVIKPLQPILTAFINVFTKDYSKAFIFQTGLFYAALVPASFVLFKEFFRQCRYPAILSSMLFLAGYPMLRTGLSYYIETGAWFFYLVSLYITLRFMREPRWKWVWINLAVSIIGFLYREYSIVSVLIMNLAIIFIPDVKKELKIKYILVFNGIFGAINLAWQWVVYVWLDFTFIDWFKRSKLTGPPIDRWWYTQRSFFALLIAGWTFVPAAILKVKELFKVEKLFLSFLLVVPLIFLFWGAILSRLYYVLAPGLIIAAVLGIEKLAPTRWVSLACVISIIALNFYFLALGQLYVY